MKLCTLSCFIPNRYQLHLMAFQLSLSEALDSEFAANFHFEIHDWTLISVIQTAYEK